VGQTRFFLGIDQTGAVGSKKNTAKALDACLYDAKTRQIEIVKLDSCNLQSILETFPGLKNQKVFVIIDCVLGLPSESWPAGRSIRELIQSTSTLTGFGRAVGEEFFSQFWSGRENYPKRLPEVLAKANSVFQTRPFQKNIQTGTYRIWKDLSADLDQLGILPFDDFQEEARQFWFLEAYPSLLWKRLVLSRTRNKDALLPFLKRKRIKAPKIFSTDEADAILMAVGGSELIEEYLRYEIPKACRQKEGWILGLARDLPLATKV
jgi:hypothetical protein